MLIIIPPWSSADMNQDSSFSTVNLQTKKKINKPCLFDHWVTVGKSINVKL